MKLSEIKYRDILCGARKEDIDKIVFEKEHQVEDRCEIGFIFGGISMIPNRVDEGIRLYEDGLINRILVSGGVGFLNTDRKVPEAYKMRRYLIDQGIPSKDIIVEDRSRNTVENIENALELLNDEYDIRKLKIALISSDFHIRRCLGLFAHELGQKETLFASGVADGKTDIINWGNNLYGARLVLTEAILLSMYAKKGKIEDLEIPGLELSRKRK